ncbi:MAG TPA: DUF2285 domain-containing protein [Kiloniellaceae bacterium]
MIARRRRPCRSARPFRLSELQCHASLLITTGGQQHLLLRQEARSLQLIVTGASVLEPVYLLTAALVDPRLRPARLAALQAFIDLSALGRIPPPRLPDADSRRRLRLVLQALDGWLADASQRDIAFALFGEACVEADWRDPRDHLRDRVRRAIRRGRGLMEGGYRALLR